MLDCAAASGSENGRSLAIGEGGPDKRGSAVSSKTSKRVWADRARVLLGKLWEWDAYSHFLLLGLGLFVLLFGLIGFLAQGEITADFHGFSRLVFKLGQLFVLELGGDGVDNGALALARIGAVLLVFLGISKVLITVYRGVFDNLRLMGLNNHVVICGLGRIGVQLARDLREAGDSRRLVVIERDRNNPHIAMCREIRAVLLIGDASDPEVLRRARVMRASHVFAVSGDDTTDVEVAVRLCELVAPEAMRLGGAEGLTTPHAAPRTVQCYVHVVDLALKELFSRHPLLRDLSPQVNVKVFNVFTNSARLLVREHLAKDRPRPSTTGRAEENEVAHYVVVGFGQMGQALALEAARLAHFENRKRLRMTIVDKKIYKKRDRFFARYPRFCPHSLDLDSFDPAADDWASKRYRPAERYQVVDENAVEYACNAEFLDMPPDLRADRLAEEIVRRLDHPTVHPSIIVCFDDDRQNFEAAIDLQAKLSARLKRVPFYVWLPVQTGLTELLLTSSGSVPTPGGTAAAAIDDIIPFARCGQSCNLDEVIQPGVEELARANHEFYCELYPQPDRPAGKPWDELPEPYRMSNFLVAEHLHVKLLAIGRRRIPLAEAPPDQEVNEIKPHEVELLAEMEHNRWLAERLLDGWSYAPTRDDRNKQHPDMWAWKDLGPGEQERDYEQVKYIPKILTKTPTVECIVHA